MIALRPGERLTPGQSKTDGLTLVYQGDGNIVLYRSGAPVWATMVFAAPGYLEMQGDGNLVAYDAGGVPYWATSTFTPGAALVLDSAGMRVAAFAPTVLWAADVAPGPGPGPSPGPGPVRLITGQVRVIGKSFGDAGGPRILHGCSDFGALAKMHEDRDRMLRQLDVVAQYHQYIRVLWRLNGGFWTDTGVTNDPIRDPWWEETLRAYLTACHERGLRVNLTSGDFYNWTVQQAEESFRRTAQIAASVSPDVCWLSAAANELRGVHPQGEDDAAVDQCEHLMELFAQSYPWGMRSISDPGDQAKDGMVKLSGGNSTCALIHDVRWSATDAIRRCFNTRYENYPGKPIVQDEPTGENGNVPYPEGQRVYQPVDDHDDILAIYTMQVLTGQASTYFSDPSLVSREPLETTWGFTHCPQFWRDIDVPENIGQGEPYHGGRAEAPMNVIDSNADRADAMVLGNYSLGGISGVNGGWRVKSRWTGRYRAWTATSWLEGRTVAEGPISAGQVFPIPGPTPTIIEVIR